MLVRLKNILVGSYFIAADILLERDELEQSRTIAAKELLSTTGVIFIKARLAFEVLSFPF